MIAALRAKQKSTPMKGNADSAVVIAHDSTGKSYHFDTSSRQNVEGSLAPVEKKWNPLESQSFAEEASDGVWRDDEGDIKNAVDAARRNLKTEASNPRKGNEISSQPLLPIPPQVHESEEMRLNSLLASNQLSPEDSAAVRVGRAVVTMRQHSNRLKLVRTAAAIVYEHTQLYSRLLSLCHANGVSSHAIVDGLATAVEVYKDDNTSTGIELRRMCIVALTTLLRGASIGDITVIGRELVRRSFISFIMTMIADAGASGDPEVVMIGCDLLQILCKDSLSLSIISSCCRWQTLLQMNDWSDDSFLVARAEAVEEDSVTHGHGVLIKSAKESHDPDPGLSKKLAPRRMILSILSLLASITAVNSDSRGLVIVDGPDVEFLLRIIMIHYLTGAVVIAGFKVLSLLLTLTMTSIEKPNGDIGKVSGNGDVVATSSTFSCLVKAMRESGENSIFRSVLDSSARSAQLKYSASGYDPCTKHDALITLVNYIYESAQGNYNDDVPKSRQFYVDTPTSVVDLLYNTARLRESGGDTVVAIVPGHMDERPSSNVGYKQESSSYSTGRSARFSVRSIEAMIDVLIKHHPRRHAASLDNDGSWHSDGVVICASACRMLSSLVSSDTSVDRMANKAMNLGLFPALIALLDDSDGTKDLERVEMIEQCLLLIGLLTKPSSATAKLSLITIPNSSDPPANDDNSAVVHRCRKLFEAGIIHALYSSLSVCGGGDKVVSRRVAIAAIGVLAHIVTLLGGFQASYSGSVSGKSNHYNRYRRVYSDNSMSRIDLRMSLLSNGVLIPFVLIANQHDGNAVICDAVFDVIELLITVDPELDNRQMEYEISIHRAMISGCMSSGVITAALNAAAIHTGVDGTVIASCLRCVAMLVTSIAFPSSSHSSSHGLPSHYDCGEPACRDIICDWSVSGQARSSPLVVAYDGLGVLLEILSKHANDASVTIPTVTVLAACSTSSKFKSRIVASKAQHPSLSSSLLSCMAHCCTASSSEVIVIARGFCRVVASLTAGNDSESDDIRRQFGRDGCAGKLVGVLRRFISVCSVVGMGCVALENLCFHCDENKNKIIETGGGEAILTVIRRYGAVDNSSLGSSSGSTSTEDDRGRGEILMTKHATVASAAACLMNLAGESHRDKVLASAGAVSVICASLRQIVEYSDAAECDTETAPVISSLAWALSNVLQNPGNSAVMTAEDGVAALLTSFRWGMLSVSVSEALLKCIQCLVLRSNKHGTSSNSKKILISKILGFGTVQDIIKVMNLYFQNTSICLLCTSILHSIIKSPSSITIAMNGGITDALATTCRVHTAQCHLVCLTIVILHRLSCDLDIAIRLIKEGCVQAICLLMDEYSSTPPYYQEGAGDYYNNDTSANNESCARDRSIITKSGCGIIGNMALCNDHAASLGLDGGVAVIVKALAAYGIVERGLVGLRTKGNGDGENSDSSDDDVDGDSDDEDESSMVKMSLDVCISGVLCLRNLASRRDNALIMLKHWSVPAVGMITSETPIILPPPANGVSGVSVLVGSLENFGYNEAIAIASLETLDIITAPGAVSLGRSESVATMDALISSIIVVGRRHWELGADIARLVCGCLLNLSIGHDENSSVSQIALARDRANHLISMGGLNVIIAAIDAHRSDATLMTLCLQCLANISVVDTEICRAVVESGCVVRALDVLDRYVKTVAELPSTYAFDDIKEVNVIANVLIACCGMAAACIGSSDGVVIPTTAPIIRMALQRALKLTVLMGSRCWPTVLAASLSLIRECVRCGKADGARSVREAGSFRDSLDPTMNSMVKSRKSKKSRQGDGGGVVDSIVINALKRHYNCRSLILSTISFLHYYTPQARALATAQLIVADAVRQLSGGADDASSVGGQSTVSGVSGVGGVVGVSVTKVRCTIKRQVASYLHVLLSVLLSDHASVALVEASLSLFRPSPSRLGASEAPNHLSNVAVVRGALQAMLALLEYDFIRDTLPELRAMIGQDCDENDGGPQDSDSDSELQDMDNTDTGDGNLRDIAVSWRIVPLLLSILQIHGDHVDVVSSAMSILKLLSTVPQNDTEFFSSGMTAAVVGLLRLDGGTPSIAHCGAVILGNLCADSTHRNRRIVLEMGGLDALSSIINSTITHRRSTQNPIRDGDMDGRDIILPALEAMRNCLYHSGLAKQYVLKTHIDMTESLLLSSVAASVTEWLNDLDIARAVVALLAEIVLGTNDDIAIDNYSVINNDILVSSMIKSSCCRALLSILQYHTHRLRVGRDGRQPPQSHPPLASVSSTTRQDSSLSPLRVMIDVLQPAVATLCHLAATRVSALDIIDGGGLTLILSLAQEALSFAVQDHKNNDLMVNESSIDDVITSTCAQCLEMCIGAIRNLTFKDQSPTDRLVANDAIGWSSTLETCAQVVVRSFEWFQSKTSLWSILSRVSNKATDMEFSIYRSYEPLMNALCGASFNISCWEHPPATDNLVSGVIPSVILLIDSFSRSVIDDESLKKKTWSSRLIIAGCSAVRNCAILEKHEALIVNANAIDVIANVTKIAWQNILLLREHDSQSKSLKLIDAYPSMSTDDCISVLCSGIEALQNLCSTSAHATRAVKVNVCTVSLEVLLARISSDVSLSNKELKLGSDGDDSDLEKTSRLVCKLGKLIGMRIVTAVAALLCNISRHCRSLGVDANSSVDSWSLKYPTLSITSLSDVASVVVSGIKHHPTSQDAILLRGLLGILVNLVTDAIVQSKVSSMDGAYLLLAISHMHGAVPITGIDDVDDSLATMDALSFNKEDTMNDDTEVLSKIFQCLRNLSVNDQSEVAIIRAGGVATLVTALCRYQHQRRLVACALGALKNLLPGYISTSNATVGVVLTKKRLNMIAIIVTQCILCHPNKKDIRSLGLGCLVFLLSETSTSDGVITTIVSVPTVRAVLQSVSDSVAVVEEVGRLCGISGDAFDRLILESQKFWSSRIR